MGYSSVHSTASVLCVPRRQRVVPVAVLAPDLAINAVDNDFGLLIDCYLPRLCSGLCLSVVSRGIFLVPFTPHGPAVFSAHHMLVLPHCAYLPGIRFHHHYSGNSTGVLMGLAGKAEWA